MKLNVSFFCITKVIKIILWKKALNTKELNQLYFDVVLVAYASVKIFMYKKKKWGKVNIVSNIFYCTICIIPQIIDF